MTGEPRIIMPSDEELRRYGGLDDTAPEVVPSVSELERRVARDIRDRVDREIMDDMTKAAANNDVSVRIKHMLDGIRRNPDDRHMSEAERQKARREWAWRQIAANVCFALTHKHRAPPPPKPRKVKKLPMPIYYDADGKKKRGVPDGAYVRVQTSDALVTVTEHRPEKSGDWGQSIKMYGPFESADEQREFMCSVWRAYTKPGPRLDSVIEQTMAWRRFDEEE